MVSQDCTQHSGGLLGSAYLCFADGDTVPFPRGEGGARRALVKPLSLKELFWYSFGVW